MNTFKTILAKVTFWVI